jgi:uncharacterized protein YqeY
MLVDDIRARLKDAMKNRRTVEKEILRVLLGEIQTIEAREGRDLTEEASAQVVRKLLKANRETADVTVDAAQKATLEEEIAILESLLPKTMTVDELIDALAPIAEGIKAAKGDGPATGIAMKYLKQGGAPVDGKTVSEAVRRLRGS